jgi:hypothetical protein
MHPVSDVAYLAPNCITGTATAAPFLTRSTIAPGFPLLTALILAPVLVTPVLGSLRRSLLHLTIGSSIYLIDPLDVPD